MSPILALILLLTIIFVVSGAVLYWGVLQISSLTERNDITSARNALTDLNEKIELLAMSDVGNNEVATLSIPSGRMSLREDANQWAFKTENSALDIDEDLEDGSAERFSLVQGDMNVTDGKLELTSLANYGYAYAETPAMLDLEVSFKVKLTLSAINSDWCGVYVRGKNTSEAPNGKGYTVAFTRPGTLMIYNESGVMASKVVKPPGNYESEVTVKIHGKRIMVEVVTGAPLQRYTLVHEDYSLVPAGYIALCTGGNNVKATFDDINIHPWGYMDSPNGPLGGVYDYTGSGDYAVVTYPERDDQDWYFRGQDPHHYRVPIEVYTGEGAMDSYPVDLEIPFSNLVPAGEKLDRNSIRVVGGPSEKEVASQIALPMNHKPIQTPSLTTRIGDHIRTPEIWDGGGVLATDGAYLYVKRWGLQSGSEQFQKIGTGMYGTERGRMYGTVGIPNSYRNDTISAFYLNGYLYNGYTPDGKSIERIDLETGGVGSLELSSPLMDRQGNDLAGPDQNILITTDGDNIICGSTGLGAPGTGYRIKMYDGGTGSLLAEKSISEASISAEGLLSYGDTLAFIGDSGTIARLSIEPGRIGDDKTFWPFVGNDGGMVNGQYDQRNNVVWLSSRSGREVRSYEGLEARRVSWIVEGKTTPYSHNKYHVYFDVYSNGWKDNPSYAVSSPPSVAVNYPYQDYTLENSKIRVSMCQGEPTGGAGFDHVYEVFDKRNGLDLQRSEYKWGWVLTDWVNYAGYNEAPYDGVTHLSVVSTGPVFTEVKMTHNGTSFLYERHYTVYRSSPMVKITHNLLARNNIVLGGHWKIDSWWNPGRGDNNYIDVDSAYGLGGHDFGSDANPLGPEYTSQEFTGLGSWNSPTPAEKAAAWYAQWNETNNMGIGTIWSDDPGFNYRYRTSGDAGNESHGITLEITPPSIAMGNDFQFPLYGLLLNGEDGRQVSKVAAALHQTSTSIGEREEIPYQRFALDSYPLSIIPPSNHRTVKIDVFFNSSDLPIYTYQAYSLDALIHTSGTDILYNTMLLGGGVITDHPNRIRPVDDLMITVNYETDTLNMYVIRLVGSMNFSGSEGSYWFHLETLRKTSYVTVGASNLTGAFSGFFSEGVYEYILDPYKRHVTLGKTDEFKGFAPRKEKGETVGVQYVGGDLIFKITYLEIDTEVKVMS